LRKNDIKVNDLMKNKKSFSNCKECFEIFILITLHIYYRKSVKLKSDLGKIYVINCYPKDEVAELYLLIK
ncbi:hypothetical protein, partial [Fervidobacterium gondwanense]|uniref:hypothetical protein n=1 Tax=Fervidobacterium gondwanense TaxID=44754 RepID=UPI003C730581